AGLEPEKGANAAIELAHQILAVAGIAGQVDGGRPGVPAAETSPAAARGLPPGPAAPGASSAAAASGGAGGLGPATVTPTVLSAGTTVNTVPALARLSVDVRVPTLAAQERVDELMRALSPRTPGTRLEVSGGPNRPPLEETSSAGLFALAQRIAAGLGLAPLSGVGVGGASDGNFTAGIGCPTLDGLGAVGGGAHAVSEHVVVAEMPGRTALLTGLIRAALG
ncbi:M20/M25/M40 family metallo-hydrolase, partial [Streptosporangium canum]|uniref:M20/M25/M40 family metallo-hydrolase n=1 Tax=Streptosporangium canum TaxID=324952 RepID=UPI00369784CE